MPAPNTSFAHHSSQAWLALVGFAAFGIIVLAWGFEIIGGMKPCPLCLKQRWAYYLAVPALFAVVLFLRDVRQGPGALLLLLVALAFAANAILAGYHSGVEWKWWEGPKTCSAAPAIDSSVTSGNLLKSLEDTRIVRCDAVAWRFLGLSFAGWNAIFSFIFALICFRVFRRENDPNA